MTNRVGQMGQVGMSSMDALHLAEQHRLRVTHGSPCVVERMTDACGETCGGAHHIFEWTTVCEGPNFLTAVMEARKILGLP